MRDPYEVLGLKRDADEAAIKAAYRKLAKRHHPDLHPGDKKAGKARPIRSRGTGRRGP
jgi:molecular chaperone DnaJ